ncbi:MAG TPA: hypothetical protein VNL16_03505 [Chloroflexota bacterium]|nr:hypothetical protein [Chloroflexota bacterium]
MAGQLGVPTSDAAQGGVDRRALVALVPYPWQTLHLSFLLGPGNVGGPRHGFCARGPHLRP